MHPIFTMLVLLLQLLTTLAMFGLIWFVQIVHYPLFVRVGEPGFRDYAGLHATRTTYVVAPLMLVELGYSRMPVVSELAAGRDPVVAGLGGSCPGGGDLGLDRAGAGAAA